MKNHLYSKIFVVFTVIVIYSDAGCDQLTSLWSFDASQIAKIRGNNWVPGYCYWLQIPIFVLNCYGREERIHGEMKKKCVLPHHFAPSADELTFVPIIIS